MERTHAQVAAPVLLNGTGPPAADGLLRKQRLGLLALVQSLHHLQRTLLWRLGRRNQVQQIQLQCAQVIVQGEFVIIPNLNDQLGGNPELGFV